MLVGLRLVRGRWHGPSLSGIWRKIAFLAVLGIVVGLVRATVGFGLALFLVLILGGLWLGRKPRRGGRVRRDLPGPGE
jgi:hypothetical protein